MRRETEQRILSALGSGGIAGLNVGRRSPYLACSHKPSSLFGSLRNYFLNYLFYFIFLTVKVDIIFSVIF